MTAAAVRAWLLHDDLRRERACERMLTCLPRNECPTRSDGRPHGWRTNRPARPFNLSWPASEWKHGCRTTEGYHWIHASSVFVVFRLIRPLSHPLTSMTALVADNERNLDGATLVLRLVIAAVFLVHGYQKVFVYGFAGVTTSFTHMGVPVPGLIAPVICVLELAGGVALLPGAFTRIVAVLLACDMLSAIIFVHAKAGFSASKGGVELVLGNLGVLVAIALLGAGAYSVDAMLARRRSQSS